MHQNATLCDNGYIVRLCVAQCEIVFHEISDYNYYIGEILLKAGEKK